MVQHNKAKRMRHQSGEIGRPPNRSPRPPVSGAPTGHSPQTLQLPELFDLIIYGAKSRMRPIAAGRRLSGLSCCCHCAEPTAMAHPQGLYELSSNIVGKHSGQWAEECSSPSYRGFGGFP